MTESNDLSFLPDDYLQRKTRRRSIAVGAGLVLAGLIATGAMIHVSRQSLARMETMHAQVSRACAEAARQIEQVRRDRDEQQRILSHAALAASLSETVPRSNILADLTNRLPEGASLLSFNLEMRPRQESAPVFATAFDMKRAALEGHSRCDAPIMDVSVRLCGIATSDIQVAGYLNQLTKSPLFQDVHLLISEADAPSRSSTAMRRFQMEMTVKTSPCTKPAEATPVMANGGE